MPHDPYSDISAIALTKEIMEEKTKIADSKFNLSDHFPDNEPLHELYQWEVRDFSTERDTRLVVLTTRQVSLLETLDYIRSQPRPFAFVVNYQRCRVKTKSEGTQDVTFFGDIRYDFKEHLQKTKRLMENDYQTQLEKDEYIPPVLLREIYEGSISTNEGLLALSSDVSSCDITDSIELDPGTESPEIKQPTKDSHHRRFHLSVLELPNQSPFRTNMDKDYVIFAYNYFQILGKLSFNERIVQQSNLNLFNGSVCSISKVKIFNKDSIIAQTIENLKHKEQVFKS